MGKWNIGILEWWEKIRCLNPLFHDSIIPIFQRRSDKDG
jgi:hypothetical protein